MDVAETKHDSFDPKLSKFFLTRMLEKTYDCTTFFPIKLEIREFLAPWASSLSWLNIALNTTSDLGSSNSTLSFIFYSFVRHSCRFCESYSKSLFSYHVNHVFSNSFFMGLRKKRTHIYLLVLWRSFFYFKKRFLKKIKSGVDCGGFLYNFARRGAKSLRVKYIWIQDTQEKNHVKFCDMDVAGI